VELAELLHAALDFERTWVATGTEVIPTPYGSIHRARRYPLVFMGNLAWVRRLPRGGVEEVLADLDGAFEGTEVAHRYLLFNDAQEAYSQQEGVARQGFAPEASIVMARLGLPVCITNPEVRLRRVGEEAPEEEFRRIAMAIAAESGWGSEESRQVYELERERAAAVGMESFVAYLGDEPAGTIALWSRGPFALIESVATLPIHRMKGVGRTMLFLAGKQAVEEGKEWTLLFTPLQGTPELMYKTLGFQPVGEIRGFLKPRTV
jgi:GNAT superfamily N-acetyltransferase